MPNANSPIEPVVKTLDVPWTPEAAFRRFTAEIGTWWPLRSHSVGGKTARTCLIEGHVGGRVLEQDDDGSEHVWGKITRWERDRVVAFTWHPGRDPEHAQHVEVQFDPTRDGCRVTLTHTGWENLGARARYARDGYNVGWEHVLGLYAGDSAGRSRVRLAALAPRLAGVLLSAAMGRVRAAVRDPGVVRPDDPSS